MFQAIEKYAADAFDPDDVCILVEAFDDAWARLQKSGVRFEADSDRTSTRDALAKCIIEQARTGDRDPTRLRDTALLQFAKRKLGGS
jgi:hypothetical protein